MFGNCVVRVGCEVCAVVVRYTLNLDLCEQTDLAIGFYNVLLALLVCFSLLFIRFTSVCCSCEVWAEIHQKW